LPDGPALIHVVDDDPAVAKALRRLLRSWGMQVRTFSSGEEFLSAMGKTQHADCSVIDMKMPGMTGQDVLERMNRAGMDVPVIIISAHEEERLEEKALKAGAIGFLRKPFSDEKLVGLIRIALQRLRKPVACAVKPEKRRENCGDSGNSNE
jgi:two-component system, LuxR family, response regulator FixJ